MSGGSVALGFEHGAGFVAGEVSGGFGLGPLETQYEELFAEVLQEAAADSHTAVTIVEKRTQGRDHPVLVGVPETYYLKCFILRRVE